MKKKIIIGWIPTKSKLYFRQAPLSTGKLIGIFIRDTAYTKSYKKVRITIEEIK